MPNISSVLNHLPSQVMTLHVGQPPKGILRIMHSFHTRKHTLINPSQWGSSQKISHTRVRSCTHMSINCSQAIIHMLVIINYLWHSFPLIVTKFCFDAMVATLIFSQSSAQSVVFTKPLRGVLCRQYWSMGRPKGWYHPPFLFQRRKKVSERDAAAAMPSYEADLFLSSGGDFKMVAQETECSASGEEGWL